MEFEKQNKVMERTEIRTIIKWYFMKGKTVNKIKAKLDAVLGGNSPAIGTIHKWVSEFKKGRTGVEDESRSGRPIFVTTPHCIAEISRIVENDKSINVRDLGNLAAASYGRVHNILQQHLKLKKICGEWSALELSDEQQQRRVETSVKCLALQQKERNPIEFQQKFLCLGASWIRPKYANNLPINSMADVDEPAVKIFKPSVESKGNSKCILVTICCDATSILRLGFRGYDEVEEIPEDHYIDFLKSLSEWYKEKQPLFSNGIPYFILQVDGPGNPQNSPDFEEKLKALNMEILPHTGESPDLMMSTIHIFPNLRKWLEGRKFFDDEAFKAGVKEYFAGLGPGHYQDGLAKLEANWRKCIELNGDYTSK